MCPVGLGRWFQIWTLPGKLAFNPTWGNSILRKDCECLCHGAAGALVYNNVWKDEPWNGNWRRCEKDLHLSLFQKRYGEALRQVPQIVFNNMAQPSISGADQLSDFSSWGVTTDGQLKPDVTAHSGNIFSSLNDNTYGDMEWYKYGLSSCNLGVALVKNTLWRTPRIDSRTSF